MPDVATVSVSRAAHFFGWNSFIYAWNSKSLKFIYTLNQC